MGLQGEARLEGWKPGSQRGYSTLPQSLDPKSIVNVLRVLPYPLISRAPGYFGSCDPWEEIKTLFMSSIFMPSVNIFLLPAKI